MADMDNTVLDQVEGEMMSPRFVDQLVRLTVDTPDENDRLAAEREDLLGQKERLVRSLASGVSAEDVAPVLKEINGRIAKIEAALRRPKPVVMNKARLRAALEQKIADWREVLRGEPRVARLLLRRLIGPITVWQDEPVLAVLDEPRDSLLVFPGEVRPKSAPWWSIPGGVPSPDSPTPVVQWRAETKPGAVLEDVSSSSLTSLYTIVVATSEWPSNSWMVRMS
jgi:hypothetical protein